MLVEDKIRLLLGTMTEGWRKGSGALFARPFSQDARFVAFDGSVHNGRDEIAAFHQSAFDTILKGTSLHTRVTEIRQIDQSTWLMFAEGRQSLGIASEEERKAESVAIFVCKADGENVEVVAFQNTRMRPVTDRATAESWKAFDCLWERARNGEQVELS